jgi:hypothetical protein
MSRFRDWNRSYSGICNYLLSLGLELDIRGQKGRPDRYLGVELGKIVNRYCKELKIRGSFTDRLLLISKDFNSFKDWCKIQDFKEYHK